MIADPNNNGTLPPEHIAQREAGRLQRLADVRLLSTPIPPITNAAQPFRYMPLVAAIGLLVVFFLVLFGVVPGAGAAERRVSVVIERVTGDAGFVVVRLDSGAILVLTPPRRAPQLQTGAAMLDSGAIWQDGWRYAINRRAVLK